MAARALAYSEQESAGPATACPPALRGAGSAEVMGECFIALLKLAPAELASTCWSDSSTGTTATSQAKRPSAWAPRDSREPREILLDHWKRQPHAPGLSRRPHGHAPHPRGDRPAHRRDRGSCLNHRLGEHRGPGDLSL